MNKNFNVAMEAISFQPADAFPVALIAILDRMRADYDQGIITENTAMLQKYGPEIEKLIFKRFGIKIHLDLNVWRVSPFAIYPATNTELNKAVESVAKLDFNIDDYEKRMKELYRVYRKAAIAANGKEGTIDFKRAKVSGYFSTLDNVMLLNYVGVIKVANFSSEEMAAFITHEIGHVFTGYEYHSRMVTMNAAVGSVLDALNNNDTDKALFIFKSSFSMNHVKASALSKDSTREDFYGAIVGNYMREMESQYDNAFPDITTSEYLADNFAAKFGLGGALISGLRLFHDSPWETSKASYVTHLITETITMAILPVVVGGFVFSKFLGPIGFIFSSLISAGIGIFLGKGPALKSGGKVYDLYRDRGLRIQREIANILKDRNLPTEIKKDMISQWDSINAITEKAVNFLPALELAAIFFVPGVRAAYSSKDRQQRIEMLMNNPLFTLSAKLNTLGE